jgi:hypothetical protein
MAWYFHACPNCGGDLHDDAEDAGWTRCLQCSRSYPPAGTVIAPRRPDMNENGRRRRRARHHDYGVATLEPDAA